MKHKKVTYNDKDYIVLQTKYNDHKIPVVIDKKDFDTIKGLKKTWRCSNYGTISCFHTKNKKQVEIFLHEVVMKLMNRESGTKHSRSSILHINRIGLDNRRENLRYNIKFKTKRNQKKKKRTIVLPASSGIKPDEIPTYVWYLKPNGSHGDRFCVEVGTVKWKTTSSKKLSLRYKLEEAKEFLRKLKKEKPNLFENHCMNGEFTKEGKNLRKSFQEIVQKAGYKNINLRATSHLTDQYLQAGAIKCITEKTLLAAQTDLLPNKDKKRRVISNLPSNCGISIKDLPKYSYYRPTYKGRGDYFVVENHPNQEKRTWQTTSSKKVSIKKKFKDLLDYLKKIE